MAVTLKAGLVGIQEYVPEYGGNRRAARVGSEFWHCDILPADKTVMQAIMRKPRGKGFVPREEDEIGEIVFREHVPKVYNLIVEDKDGSPVKVDTGIALWRHICNNTEYGHLAAELLDAVARRSVLDDGLKKNLDWQSDGSQPTTDPRTGTASSAAENTERATAPTD